METKHLFDVPFEIFLEEFLDLVQRTNIQKLSEPNERAPFGKKLGILSIDAQVMYQVLCCFEKGCLEYRIDIQNKMLLMPKTPGFEDSFEYKSLKQKMDNAFGRVEYVLKPIFKHAVEELFPDEVDNIRKGNIKTCKNWEVWVLPK